MKQPTGHWLTTATKDNLPRGDFIEWVNYPNRGSVGMVGSSVVAKIRKGPNKSGWIASLTGYVWEPTEGSVAAKIRVKESTVRRFNTLPAAKYAIEMAWANRPK